MDASECIEQKGIVEEITSHCIRVKIHRDAGCGGCDARGICNLSNDSERIIEVVNNSMNLKTGDHVGITITRGMGNKALILGYLIPFLLLLMVLLFFNARGFKELLTGLISLAVLFPYYILLYLFRDRLRKSFTFAIRKKEF